MSVPEGAVAVVPVTVDPVTGAEQQDPLVTPGAISFERYQPARPVDTADGRTGL